MVVSVDCMVYGIIMQCRFTFAVSLFRLRVKIDIYMKRIIINCVVRLLAGRAIPFIYLFYFGLYALSLFASLICTDSDAQPSQSARQSSSQASQAASQPIGRIKDRQEEIASGSDIPFAIYLFSLIIVITIVTS